MNLPALSLAEVEESIGVAIESLKAQNKQEGLHLVLSIAEYLKDARRWHWAKAHWGPDGVDTSKLNSYVDAEIQNG